MFCEFKTHFLMRKAHHRIDGRIRQLPGFNNWHTRFHNKLAPSFRVRTVDHNDASRPPAENNSKHFNLLTLGVKIVAYQQMKPAISQFRRQPIHRSDMPLERQGRKDYSHGSALLTGHSNGRQIRYVIQFIDRLLHLLTRFFRYNTRISQSTRHRHTRDTRSLGHLLNGHVSFLFIFTHIPKHCPNYPLFWQKNVIANTP